jgi:hypothetical protein
MRKRNEICQDLLKALAEFADERLARSQFERGKKSLRYWRRHPESLQAILVNFFPNPVYHRAAEAHLYPRASVEFHEVGKKMLEMVEGDALLMANAPGLVMNAPCELIAPLRERRQWYATGNPEIERCTVDIVSFAEQWVVPFLDELRTTEDPRVPLKQSHWYLAVAAAYCLENRDKAARKVLQKHLGDPATRRRYSAAFRYFDSKRSKAES